ncbi:hypothetical protein, partial [Escherichia coli]
VLDAKKDEAGFKESLEALSRVMNIAVKCDNKVTVDPSAFENDQENELYVKYQKVAIRYMESKDENERFEQLVSLQSEIESYFENTMVMA